MAVGRIKARHLVLGAVVALIVAVVAIATLTALMLREWDLDNWQRQLSTLTLTLAEQTDQSMASAEIALEHIAEDIDDLGIRDVSELRAKARTVAVHRMLADKISSQPVLGIATVVADNGDVINSSWTFPAPGVNVADRDYFQARRDDPGLGTLLSLPVRNKANGTWQFSVSRRLNDASGRFMGLVAVSISVDKLSKFYQVLGERLGEGASITLLRSDFTTLARWPVIEEAIGKQNLTGSSHRVVAEMGKTEGVVHMDGPRFLGNGLIVPRLGAVKVLERFPLIVNLTVTDELSLAGWYRTVESIAAVAAACVLALLLAAVLLLRVIRQREASEVLLRDLSDQVPGMLFQFRVFLDGRAHFSYANRAFFDFYGLAPQDLPVDAETIFAFQHPDDSCVVRASIAESMRTLQPWHLDYRLEIPGQGTRWRHGDARPQRLEDGSVLWHGYIADISDIKAAEQELARTVSVLTATLDSTDDGILVVNPHGTWTVHNRRFIELWQMPEEITRNGDNAAALSFVLGQLVEPDAFSAKVHDLCTAPEAVSFDTIELKDGRVFERYSMPQRIAGKVEGRVWSFRDVTARRRAEAQVVESLNLLRAVIDTSPVRIFWKDTNLRYLGCNPAFAEDACKASPSEVIGKDDYAMGWPDQAERYRADDRQVMESGIGKLFYEERQTNPQGNVRWLRTSKVPLRDSNNRIVGVLGLYEDITEHKRIEAEREAAMNRVRKIASRVPGVVFEFRRRPDGTSCFPYASEAIRQIYRVSPEEVREDAAKVFAVLHPEDRERVEQSMLDSAAGMMSWNQEYRVKFDDGSVRWLFGSAIPEREADGSICWHGFITDITEHKRLEAEREEVLTRLKKIADRVPGMVYQFRRGADGSYAFPYASGAVREIFNASAEEVCADISKIFDCILSEDRERVIASIERSAADFSPWACEFRVRFDAAPLRWLLGNSVPEREPDGSILWHGFVTDITERKVEEERRSLAASVFSHAREGIMITAADGTIIEVNDAFTRITGYTYDEVVGHNPRILSSGRHGPEYYQTMWRSIREKGHWYGEIWNRRKNGEVYAEMQTVTAVRGDGGEIRNYVALFSDITVHKEHQRQLEHIAHYDALTGLPNRVLLADRLHQAMVRAQRRDHLLGIAYLDLDGFKAINDIHGHEAGDQLLTTLAGRMRQALREGDTLARLGGDEFVAVLLDLESMKASVAMLQRLLTAAAQPVQVGDILLQVSASVGVTYYPQAEDVDADQLLRQADQAMYQAKLAGKNRFHLFDTEHDRSVRGHHESLESIRRALRLKEFVLHYQPKVNMRSGEVIGAEALIRWQHPEKGLLHPFAFLPTIEDHPLAVDVGEWVIENALHQMEHWHNAGLRVPVSVNVGAYQLQRPDFAERIAALLRVHPMVAPEDLQFEVLETSALEDLAQTSKVIEACRELGVTFALDDFGTGYSSLTYLKRLAVAQLKIDQSFVRDMLSDPEDLAILEGVLGLATAFRREVIAEGVETVAHGKLLLQLGCERAQGYGIARPMPAAEFAGWSALWQPDPSWLGQRSVGHEDLPLLFAGVEHRAWIIAMSEYLTDGRETPPALDGQMCRFGAWLEREGSARYAGHPALATVESLHRRVHALAVDLHRSPERGQEPKVLAGLRELNALRDKLLTALESLLA